MQVAFIKRFVFLQKLALFSVSMSALGISFLFFSLGNFITKSSSAKNHIDLRFYSISIMSIDNPPTGV